VHRITDMKQTVLSIVLVCCLAISGRAAQRPSNVMSPIPETYELYSWQDSEGRWNFSLLYNTSIEKTTKQIFNNKTVIRSLELKRKISGLSAESTIILLGRLIRGGPAAKGSKRPRYPPTDIIDEIRRTSEAHHIEFHYSL